MAQELDYAFKFGSGRYIQCPDAIHYIGKEAQKIGTKAYVIGGVTAFAITRSILESTLKEADIQWVFTTYEGYTTHDASEKLAADAHAKGCDIIIGVGGGRIMDLAKAIANYAKLPVISVPTQAATCAAYTPMSVMYTKEGGALGTIGGNFYHDFEVAVLIVDETIMLNQPARYVASGILDAMAKYIEVQNGHSEMTFDQFNIELFTAYKLAEYTYEILEKTCLKIYDDIENHRLTKEVHDYLFINFALTGMISGISKALGQTALAHELYYAARMFFTQESLSFLHGEIVGTGLILQLQYNNTPEKIEPFKAFMKKMGMPLTLGELGIPNTDSNFEKIYDYLKTTHFVRGNAQDNLLLYKSLQQIAD